MLTKFADLQDTDDSVLVLGILYSIKYPISCCITFLQLISKYNQFNHMHHNKHTIPMILDTPP